MAERESAVSLAVFSNYVFIWVKETKGVPLEMVPALFTEVVEIPMPRT